MRFRAYAIVVFPVALFSMALGYWMGRSTPELLSGRELQALVNQRHSSPYTSWHLYKFNEDAYWLRSPRSDSLFPIDHRWVVHRWDVRIENGENGSAAIGPVGLDQFVLLVESNKGVEEVRF